VHLCQYPRLLWLHSDMIKMILKKKSLNEVSILTSTAPATAKVKNGTTSETFLKFYTQGRVVIKLVLKLVESICFCVQLDSLPILGQQGIATVEACKSALFSQVAV
jgi:hypothetical protein